MSDQIAHKVSVAITVEWILKQAGALQTGKSGTTTATVFDEVDGSFSTPTVTEPITGIYRCSFTPDAAGLWHVKIVETSLPEAIVMSYRIVAVVDSEDLAAILADTNVIEPLVSTNLDTTVSSRATPAQVNTEVDTALVDVRLDELIQNAASPATPTINSFWDRITSKDGSQTFDRSTDSLEAVRDALAAGGLTAQQVRDAMKLAPTAGAPSAGSVDEHLDDILSDTNVIEPLVTTNLNATVSSRATPAQVNTEVDTALSDIRLDELIQNAAAPADPTTDSFIDLITSKDAGQTFDRSTDSLEAIRDSAAGAGITQQQVRDAMKLAPTVGAPAAGSVDEHLDDILADTNVVEPLVTLNLDATVSSRATPAQVNTEVDAALVDIRLDELIQNAAAPATPTIDSFVDRMTSKDGLQAYDRSTDSLEAIRDSVGGGGLTAQQVRDAMKLAPTVGAPDAGSVDEHLDDILADTAAMQPLVDVAISTRATPAQVNTEVDTALADIRLDELIQNAAAPTTPAADSFVDRITSKNGAQTYDRSTDSLEAIVDGGGAGLTQQQVADALLLAPAGIPAAGSVYSEFDVLMGPGFNPATDSLEEIRDEVDACCGIGGGNGADVINVEGI